MRESLRNINKYLDAEGVVKLIEMKQAEAKRRLAPMLNSAGIAKPGKSAAVRASAYSIDAASHIIRWIEDYIKGQEREEEQQWE